jgi:hypothetical protein
MASFGIMSSPFAKELAMDKILVKILALFDVTPIVLLTEDEDYVWEAEIAHELWGCDCLACRQSVRRGGWLADRSE